jgi:hypothetical protein
VKVWLGAWLLAMTVVAPQGSLPPPPKAPVDLAYGPVNYGLQMGAWFDQEHAKAYCAIRNGTNGYVRYCDYLVGNFEFVALRARRSPSEAWRWIPRHRYPMEGYLSAGPMPGNIRWLRSGRLMPPGPFGSPPAAARRKNLQHTLEVDLHGYDFPEDWTGDVECRIVQQMLNDVINEESAGNRALESPTFMVRLPLRPHSSSGR